MIDGTLGGFCAGAGNAPTEVIVSVLDKMGYKTGIGLYKIKYEMDVQGSTRDQNYMAGVMAYSSDEAVQTLIKFARESVKGFKGMRTHEVAFEGPIHSMSEAVKEAVLKTATLEGRVVSKED